MTAWTLGGLRDVAVSESRPLIRTTFLGFGVALVSALVASFTGLMTLLIWLVLFVILVLAVVRPAQAVLGMLVVAFLLPFAVVPVPIWGVQPPVFETGLAVTLVSFLIRQIPCSRRWPNPVFSNVSLWVSGFLLTGVVTTLLAVSQSWDVQQLQYASKLGLGVSAFYLAQKWSRSSVFVRSFVILIVVSGVIQSLIATAMYLNSSWADAVFSAIESVGYPAAVSAIRYLPDGETVRAVGTAVDPNVLGVILAIASVTAAALASSLPFRKALLCWVLVLAILPGLALSMSRGAWLGTAAAALVLVWCWRPAVAWILLSLGVVAVGVPSGLGPLEHLRSGLLARDASAALRLDELTNVPKVVRSSPAFGVGFLTQPVARYSLEISNALLWTVERMGVVGMSFYLAGVATLHVTALRKLRAVPAITRILPGFLAANVAGLVDHHIVSMPHIVALYWLVGGVLFAIMVGERVQNRN